MLAALLFLTLCDPMDCSLPGSSVHGIPRTLEWVAIPFKGDLPYPGIEPGSPTLQADSLPSGPSQYSFLPLDPFMVMRTLRLPWQRWPEVLLESILYILKS